MDRIVIRGCRIGVVEHRSQSVAGGMEHATDVGDGRKLMWPLVGTSKRWSGLTDRGVCLTRGMTLGFIVTLLA